MQTADCSRAQMEQLVALKDGVEAARRESLGDFGDEEERQKDYHTNREQMKIVRLHGAVTPRKLAVEEPNPCWYGEDYVRETVSERPDHEAPSLPVEPGKPAHGRGTNAEDSEDDEGDPFVADVETVGRVEVEEGGERSAEGVHADPHVVDEEAHLAHLQAHAPEHVGSATAHSIRAAAGPEAGERVEVRFAQVQAVGEYPEPHNPHQQRDEMSPEV